MKNMLEIAFLLAKLGDPPDGGGVENKRHDEHPFGMLLSSQSSPQNNR